MPSTTRAELILLTKQYMDGEETERWSTEMVLATLDQVFDAEWSNILNVAPYYRFGSRSVTTAADGTFPMSDLSSGSADSEQNFYRILGMTDGVSMYDETRYQDIPLATVSNYTPYQWDRLYYMAGTNVQVIPAAATSLTVVVNYKPTAISDLSADSIVPDFPANSVLMLAWMAGAKLLMKGGEESQAAVDLLNLAKDERDRMLADISRRTINPSRMMPLDDARDWGSW